MPKHGFVRTSRFALLESGSDYARYQLCSSDVTRKSYPFDFELSVRYGLCASALTVSFQVSNRSGRAMPFSLGAHPGFSCALGDRLIFEQTETAPAWRMNEQGYLTGTVPFFQGEKEVRITKDLFAADALMFEGLKSTSVTLECQTHGVRVEFGDCPYLGLWAKPGAPYVCIEPWFGINDSVEEHTDFYHKKGIVCLEPEGDFEYSYQVTVF